ncbi:MAG: hypothetical protein EBU97_07040, partial [Rhodobacteraceae bacterium]|nr:hypothetical protein [Paracoccaceae bacterium]
LWFILWRAIKAVPNSVRDVVRELQTYVPAGVRPTEAEAEHLRNFGRAMAVDAERAKEEEMELDSVIVLLERGRAASGAAS